jgi:uncharacterized BrkB/YihY/UPF0761 family membrane protein
MTIGRARAILSGLWIGCSIPLVVVAMVLSMTKFDKEEWDIPWTWLVPLIIPTLSLIVAVWSTGGAASDRKPVKSREVFWGTIALTLLYFLAIYLVIFLYPLARTDLATHLRTSVWYLGLLQCLATLALGKFYFENAR